jgi:hypothetical protein
MAISPFVLVMVQLATAKAPMATAAVGVDSHHR